MSYHDAEYWKKRADMLYYAALDRIVRVVGKDATSIIDVGFVPSGRSRIDSVERGPG